MVHAHAELVSNTTTLSVSCYQTPDRRLQPSPGCAAASSSRRRGTAAIVAQRAMTFRMHATRCNTVPKCQAGSGSAASRAKLQAPLESDQSSHAAMSVQSCCAGNNHWYRIPRPASWRCQVISDGSFRHTGRGRCRLTPPKYARRRPPAEAQRAASAFREEARASGGCQQIPSCGEGPAAELPSAAVNTNHSFARPARTGSRTLSALSFGLVSRP